jgi:hypothetical protein
MMGSLRRYLYRYVTFPHKRISYSDRMELQGVEETHLIREVALKSNGFVRGGQDTSIFEWKRA